MKHIDILYGLEVIIFKHRRKQEHYELLDKLIEKGYIDIFTWFDEKKGRHQYQLNATHKGLMYYATKKKKGRYRFIAFISIIVALIPLAILLSQSI